MYTMVEFGSKDCRDMAGNLPKTLCREGLRWWYVGSCDAIQLTDSTDKSLILSLDTCDTLPSDAKLPAQLKQPLDDLAHALAAAFLLGKHLPTGEARKEAL